MRGDPGVKRRQRFFEQGKVFETCLPGGFHRQLAGLFIE